MPRKYFLCMEPATCWKKSDNSACRLRCAYKRNFINAFLLLMFVLANVETANSDNSAESTKQNILEQFIGVETIKEAKVVLLHPGYRSRGTVTVGHLFMKGCWYVTDSSLRIHELLDIMNANLMIDEDPHASSWEPREGIILRTETDRELTFLFSVRHSDGAVKGYNYRQDNTIHRSDNKIYTISKSIFLDMLMDVVSKIGPSPQEKSADLQVQRMCSTIGIAK
jgi:hypothetical protein